MMSLITGPSHCSIKPESSAWLVTDAKKLFELFDNSLLCDTAENWYYFINWIIIPPPFVTHSPSSLTPSSPGYVHSLSSLTPSSPGYTQSDLTDSILLCVYTLKPTFSIHFHREVNHHWALLNRAPSKADLFLSRSMTNWRNLVCCHLNDGG